VNNRRHGDKTTKSAARCNDKQAAAAKSSASEEKDECVNSS